MIQTIPSTFVRALLIPCAIGGALSMSACDPDEIIPPADPDRCDVGRTTLCQPDPAPKPGPGNVGG